MNRAYLSLGSNLGDRMKNLTKAVDLLEQFAGPMVARSAIYETEPWGAVSKMNYYNQAVELTTTQGPFELLNTIHDIEKQCGRIPSTERYAPRTLDIDILFFNRDIMNQDPLILPHPGIPHRRFVLVPLADIAPLFVHPVTGRSIRELLRECTDDKKVIRQLR